MGMNSSYMRDEFRKHKAMKLGQIDEEAKQEALEEFTRKQISFDVAAGLEEARTEHEETVKDNGYDAYQMDSSLGEMLKQIGMGNISMEDAEELSRILDEGENYVPGEDAYDNISGEYQPAEYNVPDVDVEEELNLAPAEDIDVEEVVAKQEKEEEKAKEEKEEKIKAETKPSAISAKIEENTKKLPKNEFVAPKQNNSKTPQIFLAVIGLIACIYVGLCASTYYYKNYTIPMAEYTVTSGGFGMGGQKSAPEEPTIMTCLIQAFATGTTTPDVLHIQPKPFAGAFFICLAVAGCVIAFSLVKKSSEKEMRVGEVYGKKHLMTKADLKAYKNQFMETDNYNQIFSKEMALSLNNKKTNRSANVLVIGGTGTGKTFKYINPNILQENSTQIITDPSGDLFNKFAPFLLNKGYNVFLFNVNDFNISSYYNPLLNVFDAFGNISEVKVDVLVDLYMKNAKAGKEAGGGDPFWDKAEKAFLTAVIYYVLENDDIPKEEKCFHTVLEKVQRAKAENQNGKAASETMLTKEINAWKNKVGKNNKGKKIKTPIYYDTFLIAPEKTANTILITTAVDLQIFATEEVNRVTRFKGEFENTNMYINFDDMAQTQSYLFLGIPQSHQAYNFLISMLYSQMYARLYELGERVLQGKYCLGYRPEIPQFNCFDSKEEMFEFVDNVTENNIIERDYINNTKLYYLAYRGKVYKRSVNRDVLVKLIKDLPTMVYKCNNNYPELPIHVNFLLDEFKNIGEIPNFLTILSTSRKYRIGSHVILQDIAQAQTIYKDKEYETLLANVDTTIFLGSILQADKEEIQKMLGKTTIRKRSQSTGQGSTPNYSYSDEQVDLVSIADLEKINQNGRDDCVVMVRDVPPYIGRKAYLTEHPKYEEFKSASKALNFDLVQFYDNREKIPV